MRLATCLGCGRLCSPGPRCADCTRVQRRIYDASRPKHHAFYRTPEWRKLSAEVRAAADRCDYCLVPLEGQRVVAEHRIPITERWDLRLDRSNVVASCSPCNTRRGRRARLPVRYRQPTLDEALAHARGSSTARKRS